MEDTIILLGTREVPDAVPLSPTQIKTYRRCARLWAFLYIAKEEDKGTAFTQDGSLIHSTLEGWLRSSKAPDPNDRIGAIAASGLHLLPDPHPDLRIERYIQFATSVSIYRGFVDCEEPGHLREKGYARVIDHKSTVDFKWAMNEADMLDDVQCTTYGVESMARNNSRLVDLSWVYYRTRNKPKAMERSTSMSRTRAEINMESIEVTAREIQRAYRENAAPAEHEPTTTACDMYGGCPMRAKCGLTVAQRIGSLMARETLAEKMRKKAQENSEKESAKPSTPEINAPEAKAKPAQTKAKPAQAKPKEEPAPAPAEEEDTYVDVDAVQEKVVAVVQKTAPKPTPKSKGPVGGIKIKKEMEIVLSDDLTIVITHDGTNATLGGVSLEYHQCEQIAEFLTGRSY